MSGRDRLCALPPNTIYALCDQALLEHFGLDVHTYIQRCRCHHAEVIQYRNKTDDDETVLRTLSQLRRLWGGILIVNDRWRLAAECDGVHIGQEDLAAVAGDPGRAIAALRAEIGEDAIIGLSTHNADEIDAANGLDVDYIGLGAYRATGTKDNARVLADRLDGLAMRSKHPVAAIGGVRFEDRFEHVAFRVMGRALFEKECM